MNFALTDDGKVRQDNEGNQHWFDPESFGRFRRGDQEVRAVQIPGKFSVGPDTLTAGGYVVYDGKRLYAMSVKGFGDQFEAVDGGVPEGSRGHVTGQRS